MRAIYLLTAFLIFPIIANSQGIFERYGLTYDANGKLIVPVVKSADRQGLAQIAAEIKDLAARARGSGKSG